MEHSLKKKKTKTVFQLHKLNQVSLSFSSAQPRPNGFSLYETRGKIKSYETRGRGKNRKWRFDFP